MGYLTNMESPSEKFNNNNGDTVNFLCQMDKTDFKIISLMVLGQDNKQISSTLKIPLSTIQRRTRRILQSELVKIEY